MVLYVVPDIHKGLPTGKPLLFYNVPEKHTSSCIQDNKKQKRFQ
jgi:hypothetical protein